jgi:ABC-type multidrug transport system ATPase subunit
VTRICDEVVFLDRGRIVAHDTPAGLTSRIPNTELRVTFSGDGSRLDGALRGRYPNVSFPAPNLIAIRTHAQRVPQAIFDIAAAGVEIRDLDIHKPTLEDVFLQIARGDGATVGV